MKSLIKLLVLVLFISCCKDKKVTPQEPLKQHDNNLAATWKLLTVTSNAGIVMTNPTDRELYTTFAPDTNTITFTNNQSIGGGFYNLPTKSFISIGVSRNDRGGWPNGPWLDMYLLNINKAGSYQIANNQLKVKTSENNTILFAKQ